MTNIVGSNDSRVLHRPVEPAGLSGMWDRGLGQFLEGQPFGQWRAIVLGRFVLEAGAVQSAKSAIANRKPDRANNEKDPRAILRRAE